MKNTLKGAAKGFTLIELMIVVAIIGILAAIALPKFADLITKSKESAVKGSLGTVRSALSIYYSDNEGLNPDGTSGANFVTALTAGAKYLDVLPFARLPRSDGSGSGSVPSNEHRATDTVVNAFVDTGVNAESWWYWSGRGAAYINCSHRDTRGSSWSTW